MKAIFFPSTFFWGHYLVAIGLTYFTIGIYHVARNFYASYKNRVLAMSGVEMVSIKHVFDLSQKEDKPYLYTWQNDLFDAGFTTVQAFIDADKTAPLVLFNAAGATALLEFRKAVAVKFGHKVSVNLHDPATPAFCRLVVF